MKTTPENNQISRIIIIVFAITAMTFFSGCTDSGDSDLSVSWIKFSKTASFQDSNEVNISKDTIHANLKDEFIIILRTQSNNCRMPKLYKQIDNGEVFEISNKYDETSISGACFWEAYLEVRWINVNLNEFRYQRGQIVKYKVVMGTRIPDAYTEIEKTLSIVID